MKKKLWVTPRVTTVKPHEPVALLVCSGGRFDCTGVGTCPSSCLPGPDKSTACSVCSGGGD